MVAACHRARWIVARRSRSPAGGPAIQCHGVAQTTNLTEVTVNLSRRQGVCIRDEIPDHSGAG
jgi:hypothetical protein